MNLLKKALSRNRDTFHSVIPEELQQAKPLCLNLSRDSEFSEISVEDTDALIERANKLLKENNAELAVGKYAENRMIYKGRARFSEVERSVHLGIDLMVPPQTPIYAPMDAIVHSFKNNSEIGDYGPTIILQHRLENIIFYTLYGHLSCESLKDLSIDDRIKRGQQFGSIGTPEENGKWPPHLHFQIISDIGEYFGDFPGVANVFNQQEFLALCPDPNYILNLKL